MSGAPVRLHRCVAHRRDRHSSEPLLAAGGQMRPATACDSLDAYAEAGSPRTSEPAGPSPVCAQQLFVEGADYRGAAANSPSRKASPGLASPAQRASISSNWPAGPEKKLRAGADLFAHSRRSASVCRCRRPGDHSTSWLPLGLQQAHRASRGFWLVSAATIRGGSPAVTRLIEQGGIPLRRDRGSRASAQFAGLVVAGCPPEPPRGAISIGAGSN